jgi:hypothetical protein
LLYFFLFYNIKKKGKNKAKREAKRFAGRRKAAACFAF